MSWRVFFDDGSIKEFIGAQKLTDICKDYINKLEVKPLFVIIDNKGFSLETVINPKKDIKILVIHTENSKIKIAATYVTALYTIQAIKSKFKNANVLLVENGKGHFVINVKKVPKKDLIKYIKSKLKKDVSIITQKNNHRKFVNINQIFQDNPNYKLVKGLFVAKDLENFNFIKSIEKDDLIILNFNFSFDKQDIFAQFKNLSHYDHREVNKEIGIFYVKGESVPGMAYWLPNGVILKNAIKEYLREEEKKAGYKEVETPIIGTNTLYKTSGHLSHYKNEMFQLIKTEHEEQYLRPMACPHHCDLFKRIPRTHNDLPLKYSEYARLYRKESSGGLLGIERVTAMELTDAHIFCKESDVYEQVKQSLILVKRVLRNLGVQIHQYTIAIRDYFDNESYGGDKKLWLKAEKEVINIAKELKLNYKIVVGEAAFYGPKIDLEVISAHSQNLSTISTIQLDFFLPRQFKLTYLNEKKKKNYVVLIHRGLASTFERLISFMMSQNNGYFPLRFAPIQIEIIPISLQSKKIINYAKQVEASLKTDFRVYLNLSDDTLSKKIRNSQKKKRNYTLIIGEEEVKSKMISIRKYKSKETIKATPLEFKKQILKEKNFLI